MQNSVTKRSRRIATGTDIRQATADSIDPTQKQRTDAVSLEIRISKGCSRRLAGHSFLATQETNKMTRDQRVYIYGVPKRIARPIPGPHSAVKTALFRMDWCRVAQGCASAASRRFCRTKGILPTPSQQHIQESPRKTGFLVYGVPKGIRTPVAEMKTRCPRPTRRWGLET